MRARCTGPSPTRSPLPPAAAASSPSASARSRPSRHTSACAGWATSSRGGGGGAFSALAAAAAAARLPVRLPPLAGVGASGFRPAPRSASESAGVCGQRATRTGCSAVKLSATYASSCTIANQTNRSQRWLVSLVSQVSILANVSVRRTSLASSLGRELGRGEAAKRRKYTPAVAPPLLAHEDP
eukprot:1195636-Prorocentrum_minimum.AAC.1